MKSFDDVKLLTVAINRLTRWTRPGLLCIGDAAHAMTPNLGQGACQALEDAVTLGVLLTGGGQSWETALRRYDELRRPRAERFVKASLRAARALQTENRLAVAARTAATRLVPPSVAGRPVRRLVEWSPPQPG